MNINIADTPNPETKKFILDQKIVLEGSIELKKNSNINIPFAKEIFDTKKVDLIYLDRDFISIKKTLESNWESLIKEITLILKKNINEKFTPLSFKESNTFNDVVSKKIEEVLTEKIRPAVSMDGGDIKLKSYKNGVAEVMLKGACSGCPSSTITLKHGVERMIKHYVPEVNRVEAVTEHE
jgi:Fe-S cluster biogenesis protein NfuA